jgi:prepilin-type N-terminal cleavage/methylation domain-containing protein
MHMRTQEPNAVHRRHRQSGFTLLEMVVVLAISIIVSVVSVISLMPLLNQQHVTNAYNTTLAAMRQARDNAVSQRASYSVTFSNTVSPNTITVALASAVFQGDQNTVIYQLPSDVKFYAATAIASTTAPDSSSTANFGTGAHAIDFGYTGNGGAGGQSTVYFCPDGSAQTSSACAGAGNWDDGVVYIANPLNLLSSRAVDLWGATGRIHGWRLYSTGGSSYQWIRQ